MYRLNIKPDIKPVKQQQQQRSCPDIMEAIEAEVHKLIECGFIREEQHSNWVANIFPVLKKNEKKSESVLTTVILMQPALKMSPTAYHLHHDWQHLWLWENIFYGWLLRVQLDQGVPRR